jgi:hypothetical protein
MRLEVRQEMDKKAKMTLAIFDGANPYWNDRMEVITRPRTRARSHPSQHSTQTIYVLNDSTLSHVGSESKGKWLARTETVGRLQRSHDRPSASSAKPLLNMFLYRDVQYKFETRGCLLDWQPWTKGALGYGFKGQER